MQLIRSRSYARSRGFTLLEVLVAMVVLSVGLLGLSGLQTSSLRNNNSAFLRSQATLATNDILDRMRANRAVALTGSYNIAYTGTPASTSCSTGCSAGDVAAMDVAEWRSYVERLPAGEGEITVSGAGIAEVKVRWGDARDGTLLQLVTRTQI
jgi:type IV pilus assembly protein PilV